MAYQNDSDLLNTGQRVGGPNTAVYPGAGSIDDPAALDPNITNDPNGLNRDIYDPTTGYGNTTSDIRDRDLINDDVVDPGIDRDNLHDSTKGAALGAVGGVVVGALAGGPLGAVVGGIVGAAASGAGVAAVDEVDNDLSPGERHRDPVTGEAYRTNGTGTV